MLDLDRMPGRAVLRALPIFPLPNVVFLPGMVLPLNVFEPRYVELVDHVLDGGLHVGVPLIGDPEDDEPRAAFGERERDLDDEPLQEVFGVGKLIAHHPLRGGRRFIRLEGLGRVRTVAELPRTHGFRCLEVEALAEDLPRDRRAFEVLLAQVERMSRSFDADDQEMVRSVLRLDDPRVVVYAIASLVPNLETLRALELGFKPAGCRLSLQQSCLDARTCDERIELLLERTGALVDHLGTSGVFPVTIMN